MVTMFDTMQAQYEAHGHLGVAREIKLPDALYDALSYVLGGFERAGLVSTVKAGNPDIFRTDEFSFDSDFGRITVRRRQ